MKKYTNYQLYLQKRKSIVVAYILLLMLGLMGVHRFYLGRYLTGIFIFSAFVSAFVFGNPGYTQDMGGWYLRHGPSFFPSWLIGMLFIVFDLFYTPKMVRVKNLELANSLGIDELTDNDLR